MRVLRDVTSYHVMLDAATEPLMAAVHRMALVIALEEFFGRVQIFGTELAMAKHCQDKWPSKRMNQAVADLISARRLN